MRHRSSNVELEACFDRLDEAFGSISAEVEEIPHHPEDFEAAFDRLDRQLARCSSATSDKPSHGFQPHARALASVDAAVRPPDAYGRLTALGAVLAVLEKLAAAQRRLAAGATWVNNEADREAMRAVFDDMRRLCVDFELASARVRADFALASLDSGSVERLHGDVIELLRHVRHDIEVCAVWPVPAARASSLQRPPDHTIGDAFPSARGDLLEGQMCLALGRYNASVFHFTRAAERGVAALARAANARSASGTSGWSAWLEDVEGRVAGIRRWREGGAKTNAQTFFEGALADARVLREAARRLLTPGSALPFDEHEAEAVCRQTHSLLSRLAERIHEEQQTTLTKVQFAQ